MILTPKQKAAYMSDGWAKCPFCKSEDVSGGQLDVEANVAWQNVSCGEGAENPGGTYTHLRLSRRTMKWK